ncbi:MAG: hypothetical protein QOF18_2499 [Frankiaceae bacterium]|jgi:hypothetical protein|nr:hypothetical protein [Frankiaceae bacterium]
MNGAMVFSWKGSIPGREAKGLEVFTKSIERFEQLAKEGRIHAHHEYIALTGTVGGFVIIEGDVEELQKISVEPETLALNSQAGAIVEGFEGQLYLGGNDKSVQEVMGVYVGALAEIGYM